MSLYAMNDQTLSAREWVRGGVRPGWIALLAVAWIGLLVGDANAQGVSTSARAETDAPAAKNPPALRTAGSKAKQSAKSAKARPSAGQVRDLGSAGAKNASQPLWVCAKPTLMVAPLWEGEQVECMFTIRNEGGRNLQINARGG